MNTGERIKRMRIDRNLSQYDLAVKIGVTHTAMGRMERGTQPLKEHYIRSFCKVFGVSPNELLGWNVESKADALRAIKNIAAGF